MAKGALGRAMEEIRHWTQSDWSFAAVERHYDRLADDYDEINAATHAHFRRFTDALRLAHLPNRARLLEIFARTGEGTAHFYQQGKVGSAACVDVSRKMGKICKERLRAVGLEDFRWVQILDYSLPFADSEFDVVLCLETVEHVSQPERLLTELGRVTRPGGILILSTPNVLWEPVHALAAVTGLHHSEGPHRFIRYKRLLTMTEKAGFRVEHAETNVLIPEGPIWMIRLGEWLERRLKHSLMPWIGLRRFLVCRRLS
ncbi:MAG TPA: SAM-dependent methyltransferase [Chloroflexi bacterium]|nr:SAM-dependent methyltransferase [Chloroflexota bacterium]